MKTTPLSIFCHLLGKPSKSHVLIEDVAIDSRKVRKGSLFFALPGNRVDGHDFLQEVAAKGGKAAVVLETYKGKSFGLELIRAPNVLEALQELARKSVQKSSCEVIAISGSVGKTTTKEFARAFLKTEYKVAANPLSYNTESTVPLSILMADGDEEILILEMGMARPGELASLISIAPPDIALLTTVAVQHATNFPDGLLGISREKATLFSHEKTRLGILHKDIDYYDEVAKTGHCTKRNFSLKSPNADSYLEFISPDSVKVKYKKEVEILPFKLPMKAYAHNLLAACALARSLDVPWASIRKAAENLTLPPMRFERVEKAGITFINDAYNANPDSVKAALESLPAPHASGKKIAVLGEMNALGMYSEGGHALIAEVALSHVDLLLCIGEKAETMKKIWKREKKEAHHFASHEELVNHLKAVVKPGDVVLLKGARALALETILDRF